MLAGNGEGGRQETEMNATSLGLHSLLFGEGRQLENFKFFPGDDRGLTASAMCDAADEAVRSAIGKGLVDQVPSTGRTKSTI